MPDICVGIFCLVAVVVLFATPLMARWFVMHVEGISDVVQGRHE